MSNFRAQLGFSAFCKERFENQRSEKAQAAWSACTDEQKAEYEVIGVVRHNCRERDALEDKARDATENADKEYAFEHPDSDYSYKHKTCAEKAAETRALYKARATAEAEAIALALAKHRAVATALKENASFIATAKAEVEEKTKAFSDTLYSSIAIFEEKDKAEMAEAISKAVNEYKNKKLATATTQYTKT
jgi:hypothetical protein